LTAIAKSINAPQKTENKLDKEIMQESDSVKLVKEKIQSLDHEVSSLQDQVKSSKKRIFFL
jgi:peptidoglycan hydrolase CwlO-like protein